MKYLQYIFLIVCIAVLLLSCKNDLSDVGISIRPENDAVAVVVDTFCLRSSDSYISALSAQCDTLSMLLGCYSHAKYGTTKADLVVQLAPPVGYVFPDSSYHPQPDSLVLYMVYKSWCGASNEPFEIAIYENNVGTPAYTTQYMADFDVSQFCDRSVLMGKQVATSIDRVHYRKSSGYRYIQYKFDSIQTQRFFDIPTAAYASEAAFLDAFKGLYITTTYGQSTMLYLKEIYLQLYYHYTLHRGDTDTVMTTYITYPASHEVRQLNHIDHGNREQVMNKRDSVNYIKSAGALYPRITVPIGRMRRKIHDSIGNKTMMINSAMLSVEATEIEQQKSDIPYAFYMLMLKSDKVSDFLATTTVPLNTDTTMVVGVYNATKKAYSFDLAYMLAKHLRKDPTNYDEELEFVLMPVTTVTASNGSVVDITPQKQLSAVTVRSGRNTYSPMRVRLVYSGF